LASAAAIWLACAWVTSPAAAAAASAARRWCPLGGADGEMVHQAARADDAQAHAGRGAVLPSSDLQVGGCRAPGPRRAREQLRRAVAFDRELDLAAAGVAEGVAHDLGHGGRDARLVLASKPSSRRDLPRALARAHHVLLVRTPR
jgi:hypothetical protein